MKKLAVLVLSLIMALTVAGCAKEKAEVENSVFKGDHVVTASYVKENADKILLFDARGEKAASEKTIATAVPVDWQYLAKCENGAPGDADWGTILDKEELANRLGAKGFDMNKEIVLFAGANKGWGEDGRIAWELLAAGYKNVKIVDGGFEALVAEGLETKAGGAAPVAVNVTIDKIDQTHDINTDELTKDYKQYKVIDVREDDEYGGAVKYGETNGGHLPGAIHIKFADLFDENGMLKSNDDIVKMVEAAGIGKDDMVVTYCTAGIRSAHMQIVLQDCGYKNVKNYDESFYRWSAVGELEK